MINKLNEFLENYHCQRRMSRSLIIGQMLFTMFSWQHQCYLHDIKHSKSNKHYLLQLKADKSGAIKGQPTVNVKTAVLFAFCIYHKDFLDAHTCDMIRTHVCEKVQHIKPKK